MPRALAHALRETQEALPLSFLVVIDAVFTNLTYETWDEKMENYDDSQSYLSHLHAEHNRLELLSKNVANRFNQSSDASWADLDRPEIAAQLSALKDELSKHIDEEDQGGCVDEAVARVPSLSQAARKIYQESDKLKELLRQVMQLVESGARVDADSAFRKFSADLRLHEQHEHDLVKRGLNHLPDDDE